ncbi:MAG: glycosyltransferase [Candidatus Limiplasma sp.]|nr:glycosyltransferase [Candidatus Limiplasma sp.]
MDGSAPLISVIVPLWRAERTLPRCVDALLGQTYTALEIILVDDGSPDGSGSLCDAYARQDERVKVLHLPNGGVSKARNAGLAVAQGDFIGFVDSDDWCEPAMYETLLQMLQQSRADIAICGLRHTDGNTALLETAVYEVKTAAPDAYWRDFFRIGTQKCIFYVMNRLYRRATLEAVRFPEGISDGEDVWFTYRAFRQASAIVETEQPLYNYYQNPESLTRSGFSERDLGLERIWQDVVVDASANRPDLLPWAELNLHRVNFTLLCRLILHDEPSTDQRFLAQERLWRKRLRAGVLRLIAGDIPVVRKCLALGLTLAYRPVKRLMRWYARRAKGVAV